MNRTRQLTGHLNNRCLTCFTVSLRLLGNRLRVDVIAFCQRVAGIQLPNRATVPYASSHQPVRDGLIHRLLNIGKQTRNASIGLWDFGCAGVEQVVQVGLNVVLQPVEPVAFVEEITAGHDALLQDGRIVLVVHKYVAVFGIQRRRLIGGQGFIGDPRLLLEFQGNGGVAAVEIHRERATES
ncbi:Uncharacterised protein [Enterobacter cloacae]|nr:Uncharacterised protein [Enterobacter cloacae]